MAHVRVRWIDAPAPSIGNKILRNDVEITDIGLGEQEYIDSNAPDDATPKYEVQSYDADGNETTQEVEGENMDYTTTPPIGPVAPDAPTNLVAGTPTDTTIPLTWTKSAGVMTEYIAYIGGVEQQTFTGDVALGTLTGLTEDTLYSNITVRAFNGLESSDSNAASATTEAGSGTGVPTANIIGYYEWEDDFVDDSGNGNTGSDNYVTFGQGQIGQQALFNSGNTSRIELPATAQTSFGNGTVDSPFSITSVILWTTVRNMCFFSKNDQTNYEYEFLIYSNVIYLTAYNQGANASQISRRYNFTPTLGQQYFFAVTFGANGTETSWNFYIDGVLQTATEGTSDAGYVAMNTTAALLTFGNGQNSATYKHDGAMDGTAIWNKELTQEDVSAILVEQQGGNRLLP